MAVSVESLRAFARSSKACRRGWKRQIRFEFCECYFDPKVVKVVTARVDQGEFVADFLSEWEAEEHCVASA